LKQNATINVTPFVDIMLVLLIVMMVAAPVATLAIKVDAPPVDSASKGPPPMFVSIGASGISIVDGLRGKRATTVSRLAGDLVATLGTHARDGSVLIRADRSVRYGVFMNVVSELNANGFYGVKLVTEDPPGSA